MGYQGRGEQGVGGRQSNRWLVGVEHEEGGWGVRGSDPGVVDPVPILVHLDRELHYLTLLLGAGGLAGQSPSVELQEGLHHQNHHPQTSISPQLSLFAIHRKDNTDIVIALLDKLVFC